MDVILDHPSVHAGDDTTSDEIRLTVPDDATVGAVLEAADLDAFLPWFASEGGSRHGRWTVTAYDVDSWRPGGPLADATRRPVARYDEGLAYESGIRDTPLRSLVGSAAPVLYFG